MLPQEGRASAGQVFQNLPPEQLCSHAAHQNSTLYGARWVRTRVRTAEFYSRTEYRQKYVCTCNRD